MNFDFEGIGNWIYKIYQWSSKALVGYLTLQAIATLTCAPFLVYYGLGFSRWSLIGNPLFAPLLSAFIFLASISLILNLLGLPTYWCNQALEQLCQKWQFCLDQAPMEWVYYVSYTELLFFTIILTMLLIFAEFWSIMNFKRRLLLALLVWQLGFATPAIKNKIQRLCFAGQQVTLKQGNGLLIIRVNEQGLLEVEDHAYFNRLRNSTNFLDFKLLPLLACKFGSCCIEVLHLHDAHCKQACLDLLQKRCIVKKIVREHLNASYKKKVRSNHIRHGRHNNSKRRDLGAIASPSPTKGRRNLPSDARKIRRSARVKST